MTTIHIALFFFMVIATGARADSLPVLIGINADFGVVGSTSAQAIRLGAQIAVDEINTAGGVLGGRSLALVEKDDRSVPARFIRNLREFAADPHVVAVLIGLLTPNTEWGRSNAKAAEALDQAARRYGIDSPRHIPSPVGVAHAYDLVHILARAIQIAGSTDQEAIRDALEQVTDYPGLVKTYSQPFTSDRYDALSLQEVFMARYAEDGAIVRIDPK